MRTKRATPLRKRPARPSPTPVEEAPTVASATPEPPADSGSSSESARAAEPPPNRRWRSPRAENWEQREGIRATLLLHLPTRRERATYRRIGQILYDASLARGEEASETAAEFAFRQVEAVLSELRFNEGFLGDIAELHDLDDQAIVARLGRLARAYRKRLSRLTDGLAQQLDAIANPR